MASLKLTIVVGLPGSGKTTFSRKLAEAQGLNDRRDGDDDFLRGDLSPPFGVDGVIERLKAGTSCVVNDVMLCVDLKREAIRKRIIKEVPGISIEWHFFDNDPVQCAANVLLDMTSGRRRDVMNRIDHIRLLAADYRPPSGHKVRPVSGVLGPRRKP